MTYSELYHSSIEISNYFTANYKNASKIALLLPNSIDMIKIINALTISPLEIILINFHLTNQEIINQLNQIDPSLLITNSQHDIHTAEDFPYPIHNISDIINESKNSSSQVSNNHSPQKNDILVNVFTSGTTGTPKIVPLSYFNFQQNIIASNDRLKVEINDNWLITIPLFHLGGLSIIFRTIYNKSALTIIDKFIPDQIPSVIKQYQITQLSLVPSMLKLLIEYLKEPLSLRFILVGGAHCPKPLLLEAITYNLPIITTYGMTESCSQFATSTLDKVIQKPNSVGKPLKGNFVKINNKDANGIGDVLIKGPSIMNNYLNKPQINEDSYFLTGDLGYLDEDQDLIVLQRRIDLIISGGENIYPVEVQNIMYNDNGIEEARVIGISNSKWGQIPIAFLKINSLFDYHKFQNMLKNNLASYKIPKKLFKVEMFPLTASGKLDINKLTNPNYYSQLEVIE